MRLQDRLEARTVHVNREVRHKKLMLPSYMSDHHIAFPFILYTVIYVARLHLPTQHIDQNTSKSRPARVI